MRRVFILAAGSGQRLRPLTDNLPKALLQIGQKSILNLQVEALTQSGVAPGEIVVITGHRHREIEAAAASLGFSTLFNPDFDRANNIVSLHKVFDAFPVGVLSDMIIVNCDVWAHSKVFSGLMTTSHEAAVVVDVDELPDDEAMKVTAHDARVLAFGKQLSGDLVIGEYIGLARFRNVSVQVLAQAASKLVVEGRTGEWYESAMNVVAERLKIGVVTTAGLPWIEIDTHEDLHRAQSLLEQVVP